MGARRGGVVSVGALGGVAAVVAAAGCASLIGIDEPQGAEAGADATSGLDAHPDAPSSTDADAEGDAMADASDADVRADGDAHVDCPVQSEGNACKAIPHFTGTQTVDGFGDEFCGIVATRMVAAQASYRLPKITPPNVDSVVTLQVAWDAIGLHAYAQVEQSLVVAPAATSYVFNGDGIELFASASSRITGPFGPGADPALQVFVSAPPALSTEVTSVSGATTTLDDSLFAARLLPGGYAVEMMLPWSTLAGGASYAPDGGQIAFDLAIDLNDAHEDGGSDAARGRYFQSSLYWTPPAVEPDGAAACQSGPFCDDLGWCTPFLLAP